MTDFQKGQSFAISVQMINCSPPPSFSSFPLPTLLICFFHFSLFLFFAQMFRHYFVLFNTNTFSICRAFVYIFIGRETKMQLFRQNLKINITPNNCELTAQPLDLTNHVRHYFFHELFQNVIGGHDRRGRTWLGRIELIRNQLNFSNVC